MITYQDLLKVPNDEKKRADFVRQVINDYKRGDLYNTAVIATDYYKHINRTICDYQKLLYTITGRAVPDNFSANFKMAHSFFRTFTLQEVQYLLGNGVTWENEDTGDRLGEDFDARLQEIAKESLIGGVAYGFFNLDHLEVFKTMEYAPLYDEEDGAMKAGIRFWQIDPSKPLRATFHEMDGYTEYIWRPGDDAEVLKPKRAYVEKVRTSDIDGTEIYDFENYPSFPVVPLWGNDKKMSELVGIREQIDCYDLIKSGFANDVDDASLIYWTIQNAGGMDDVDLAKFVERMKTVHAAVVEDSGAHAEAHSVEAPYGAREALLNRLREDMYRDAMALDPTSIASGAVTATQIKAAYEPLNSKVDDFEYCVHDFLDGVLKVAGIEDDPTFTRSKIVNTQEEVQVLISAGEYLDPEYITQKVLTLYGDGDLAEEMTEKMMLDEANRNGFEDEFEDDESMYEEIPEEETEEESMEESDGIAEIIEELEKLMEEL